MTKREFYLGVLIVMVVAFVLGPASYFMYQASVDKRETELLRERERTERSINRWDAADRMWQRIPFMKKDEPADE